MFLAVIAAIILAVTFIRELVLAGLLGLGILLIVDNLGAPPQSGLKRLPPSGATGLPCDVMTTHPDVQRRPVAAAALARGGPWASARRPDR